MNTRPALFSFFLPSSLRRDARHDERLLCEVCQAFLRARERSTVCSKPKRSFVLITTLFVCHIIGRLRVAIHDRIKTPLGHIFFYKFLTSHRWAGISKYTGIVNSTISLWYRKDHWYRSVKIPQPHPQKNVFTLQFLSRTVFSLITRVQ